MTQIAGIFAVEKHNVSGLIIGYVCSWVADIKGQYLADKSYVELLAFFLCSFETSGYIPGFEAHIFNTFRGIYPPILGN